MIAKREYYVNKDLNLHNNVPFTFNGYLKT